MKDKIVEMIISKLLKKGVGTAMSNIDMELEIPSSMVDKKYQTSEQSNIKVKIKIDNIEIKFENE